jgi:hypothetical protein
MPLTRPPPPPVISAHLKSSVLVMVYGMSCPSPMHALFYIYDRRVHDGRRRDRTCQP